MKIFISGGSGFVGTALCRLLTAQGHTLRLLAHRHQGKSGEGTVEYVAGDLTSPLGLESALVGCDAVINLVGIIREIPGRGITFDALHRQATENLVGGAVKCGIRRYLQMSALGTRANAVSAYHRTKWQAEQLVRNSPLDWTIFQPSLIFGPGDSFINMLAAQLRYAPVMPVIGSGAYRLQPVHVDDVARCFTLALEMPVTVRQTYELCGAERLSYSALLDLISAALGRSSLRKPRIPVGLMKMVIPLMQSIPQFPITMDQLQMLLEESIGSSDWQQVFGFAARDLATSMGEYVGKCV